VARKEEKMTGFPGARGWEEEEEEEVEEKEEEEEEEEKEELPTWRWPGHQRHSVAVAVSLAGRKKKEVEGR